MPIVLNDLTFLYYNLVSIFHDYIHDCTRQGSGTARLNVGLKKFHQNHVHDQELTIFGGGRKKIKNQKGGIIVMNSKGETYDTDERNLIQDENGNFFDTNTKQYITFVSPAGIDTSFSSQGSPGSSYDFDNYSYLYDNTERGPLYSPLDIPRQASGIQPQVKTLEQIQVEVEDTKIYLRDVYDNIKLMFFGYGDWSVLTPKFIESADFYYKLFNSSYLNQNDLIIQIWKNISGIDFTENGLSKEQI